MIRYTVKYVLGNTSVSVNFMEREDALKRAKQVIAHRATQVARIYRNQKCVKKVEGDPKLYVFHHEPVITRVQRTEMNCVWWKNNKL